MNNQDLEVRNSKDHTDLANRNGGEGRMRRGANERRARLSPAVDVYENASELLLVADLPGATTETVNVQFQGDQLTLAATRTPYPSVGNGTAPAVEYYRSFALPQGLDGEAIEATFLNGVLNVKLPKATSQRPRRIDVKSA